MERKEFMKSIGAGAAFAVTFGCLGGCLREELDPLDQFDSTTGLPVVPDTTTQNTPETPGDTTVTDSTTPPAPQTPDSLFTVDLTSSEGANLADKGGYIIKDNIVVAQNLSGAYVAATVVCSHDILKKVIFKNDEYYCTEHGARFDQTGKGLNDDGKRGLRIYETSITGDILSVLA